MPADEKLAAEELIDSCYAQLEEGIQLLRTIVTLLYSKTSNQWELLIAVKVRIVY